MDLQPLAWPRVDHRARHAVKMIRLVDVGGDQLVGLGDQVGVVEVLAVDHRGERTRVNLGLRDQPIFMTVVAHAVATVLHGRHHLVLRAHRAVVGDALDLEVDVALGAVGRFRVWRADLHTDLGPRAVPQHRVFGRDEQVVEAIDLEVDVGPAVKEYVPERAVVEADRKRALAVRTRRPQVVVEQEILVPRLNADTADAIAGELVDHSASDLELHAVLPVGHCGCLNSIC